MSDLPTVYHGIPEDNDDTRAVQAALQAVIGILNSAPDRVRGRVIASILVTACCGQDDPIAAFQELGELVGREIGVYLMQP